MKSFSNHVNIETFDILMIKRFSSKASKSEPYGVELNNERMLELQAKCASYETELARLRKENEDLLKQLLSMEEV